MKNVTKILTTVVLCAAVFASTQRTSALGGNAAFWPDDEANIAAFPANINNHQFVQVTNMGTDDGASVDMVFGSGDHNWSLGFSNSNGNWFDLGWGNGSDMGINLSMTAQDQTVEGTATVEDGMVLSFGKSGVLGGNLGFIYTSSDDWDGTAGTATPGFVINYAKEGCSCWVFDNMVAQVNSPDDGDMSMDLDWWGNMGEGAATVMFAMGLEYDAADSGIRQTANLGIEADVTSNLTLRGGMEWGYDVSNDDDSTGANGFGWSTGAGVNFGALEADFTLTNGFWSNPWGAISGNDDSQTWGSVTMTYNF